jgi:uncharacterized protein
MKYTLISIFFLLCSFVLYAQADKDFPEPPNPPRLVTEFATKDVLSRSEEADLEQKLRNYYDTTSNQFAIVIMDSVPGGYDYSDYAERLAEKWKIGVKGKDNGLLIFIPLQERKIWIATGYGLEPSIPDSRAKIIIDNYITPYFKNGQFYKGLDEGTTALMQAAAGQFKADPKAGKNDGLWTIIIILVIIFLIFMMISKRRNNRYNTFSGRGISRGPFFGPFGGSGGGGGWSGGGGSDSGSFGGFGGGDFGGGGAGGDW